jgi:hypothetical protein
MMTKNRVFVLGMLALALTFGVAQQASAQVVRTAKERDEILLNGLKEYPYYIVIAGDTINAVGARIPSIAPSLDGASYMVSGSIVIAMTTSSGVKCVLISFSDTKETLEKSKAEQEGYGHTVFGPFNAGSIEATREAALKRILDGVNIAKPDTIPKEW